MAILIARLHFEDQAQALDAFDQLDARATNTGIVGLGGPNESTSYTLFMEDDGTVLEAFHVDTFGIVREGEYTPPPNQHPIWKPVTDATKAYPAVNAAGEETHVEHNDINWRNAHGDGNTWEPGTVNETIWENVGEVE